MPWEGQVGLLGEKMNIKTILMYTWRRNLLLSHVQPARTWFCSSANQDVCCRWFGRSDVARSKCLLETISARWVLWLRPGWECQLFPCWLLFVLKKNKQERRFRLAVTTFPVFVKRSPLISYKPPEYIRCKIYLCTFLFLSVYHVWFFDHFSSIPYWDARRTSSSLMITRFHIRMKLIVLTAKQMVPQYGQWDMRWLRIFENHWYWLTETLTFSNFLRATISKSGKWRKSFFCNNFFKIAQKLIL